MARKSRFKKLTVLGRGNNGAVLQGSAEQVHKWTVDPVEVQVWLAVQALRNRGEEVEGFPEIFDIRLGNRSAVITREDVIPLGLNPTGLRFDPRTTRDLQRGSRLLTSGRINRSISLIRRAVDAQDEGMSTPMLQRIRDSVRLIQRQYGVRPLDVRPANIGHLRGHRNAAVLLDTGRTPIETLAIAPGEAYARCPNESALATAVTETLGAAPSYGSCSITGAKGLREVMNKHGWKDEEIAGTAGFHTEPHCNLWGSCKPGDIVIRRGNEWSILHELVHAAGVVDKGLAPWLTEGITEAAAQAIAEAHGWKHHPTYPQEVGAVHDVIGPALQQAGLLTSAPPDTVSKAPALQLAEMVVASPKRAAHTISRGLARSLGGAESKWYSVVGTAGGSVASFHNAARNARETRRQQAKRRNKRGKR